VRILVTGATGLVGSHAVARLVRDGHTVRALVRDPARLTRVMEPHAASESVEARQGDVTDPASVEAALADCDGLLHAAGIFSHRREDTATLRAVNVDGARVVLEAGLKADVARSVFVSSALAIFPTPGPRQRADDPVTAPRTLYATTKALAERHARALAETSPALCIVYPSMVMGPHDPTVGGGPGVMVEALRSGQVLVTDGGLPYTDVRDLADYLASLFAGAPSPQRSMAPARFLPHEEHLALLRRLTGRDLAPRRIPGPVLRALGRLGDLTERLTRRPTQLTHEAAVALTRMVPVDVAPARALLGRDPCALEDTLRDTMVWMHRTGVLEREHVGRLADAAR
jgi:nucleoside-diphosphate-sugar epimerase